MDKLLGAEHPFERASSHGLKSSASFVQLSERGGYAEMGHNANRTLIRQEHLAKLGLADRDGILQHRLEHRLQLARRAADYAQHLGRRRLLLQRFAQIVRPLAQLFQQAGVIDRDDRLVGKRADEIDLLFTERLYLQALERQDA